MQIIGGRTLGADRTSSAKFLRWEWLEHQSGWSRISEGEVLRNKKRGRSGLCAGMDIKLQGKNSRKWRKCGLES